MTKRYKANITAGALLIPETKKICKLLLNNKGTQKWQDIVVQQNILQKRSINSTKRIANLIYARLKLVRPEFWRLIRDANHTIAAHSIFATAVKHSALLGDYLDLVVRTQLNKLDDQLSPNMWEEFLQECHRLDPEMPDYSVETSQKLRTNIHKILSEVGYLNDTKRLSLSKVEISPEVIEYLQKNNEHYVLKCIQL